MKEKEKYWSYRAPPTPEFSDLPSGLAQYNGERWGSLSPGMRRTIWRDAILLEAQRRGLPSEIVDRIKAATISGSLPSLDEYLLAFEAEDERRAPMMEDMRRLQRADELHTKSSTQIAARETL